MQCFALEDLDLRSMTLQVGLVGTDGIVLASDRLEQQFERSGARSVGEIDKILSAQNVVCCYSGDILAQRAANRIRDFDWNSIPAETEAIRPTLIGIGSSVYQEELTKCGRVLGYVRKVIVVLHGTHLWLLQIDSQSLANPRLDRVIAGDDENTCRYFFNRYAGDCNRRLSTTQLVSLAAFGILTAGEENPRGIKGLQIAVLQKGKEPLFLSSEQENELKKRFGKTESKIRKAILQPFDYR